MEGSIIRWFIQYEPKSLLFWRFAADDNLAGANDAVVEDVALLGFHENCVRRDVGAGHLSNRLMEVGVKGLIDRFDRRAVVFAQNRVELLDNHLDAVQKRLALLCQFS